ncbi:MAG: tripartite tricarboxylate transporter substrate binding protein [Sheuella sp.]|nr:tripartite tricarboxylate transporter substrate binding protein [Sheuella sp.]
MHIQFKYKKNALLTSVLLLSTLSFTGSSLAQTSPYPNKPIRFLVGFAPAGAADYVARVISDPLSKALGQPVIVENRAGAGSSIAADLAAKAAPDGYTILLASPSSISVNPALNPKLNYSAKDLLPVTKVTSSPLVIAVNTSTGINSIQELIAKAKSAPGVLNYATSGNGSAPHLAAALFLEQAGVEMMHIPFKGGSLAIQSVVSGDTQLTFGTPPSVLPMVQAGRLKAIGVSWQESTNLVPGVPGMKESGMPDYSMDFWYGIFVPVGTPATVIQKLFEATQSVMALPNVRSALAREGTDVSVSESPAAFRDFLMQDEKFWIKLVRDAGVKLD